MPLEVNPGPMNWGAEGVQISGEGKGTNARLRLSDCGALPPLVLTQAREDTVINPHANKEAEVK